MSVDAQVAAIMEITDGQCAEVFDASVFAGEAGIAALRASRTDKARKFVTANSW